MEDFMEFTSHAIIIEFSDRHFFRRTAVEAGFFISPVRFGLINMLQLTNYQEQKQDIKEPAKTSKYSTVSPALTFFHIPIPEIKQGPFKDIVGQYREYVACSFVNSGVLKTLVSMGDVKAVFIGHDHKNDFCGNLDGIWFCYGGGFGYHGYGVAGWSRRARVILAELGKGEKSWNGVEKIKTWKRLDDGMLSKIDEQILWER